MIYLALWFNFYLFGFAYQLHIHLFYTWSDISHVSQLTTAKRINSFLNLTYISNMCMCCAALHINCRELKGFDELNPRNKKRSHRMLNSHVRFYVRVWIMNTSEHSISEEKLNIKADEYTACIYEFLCLYIWLFSFVRFTWFIFRPLLCYRPLPEREFSHRRRPWLPQQDDGWCRSDVEKWCIAGACRCRQRLQEVYRT